VSSFRFQVFPLDGLVVSALLADGAEALRVAVADDQRAAAAIGAAGEAACAALAVGVATCFLRWFFWDFGDHWGLGGLASWVDLRGEKTPQLGHVAPYLWVVASQARSIGWPHWVQAQKCMSGWACRHGGFLVGGVGSVFFGSVFFGSVFFCSVMALVLVVG
jgi:hypothetical protein